MPYDEDFGNDFDDDFDDYDDYDDSMNGDHESALESVYGPLEDGMYDRDWE